MPTPVAVSEALASSGEMGAHATRPRRSCPRRSRRRARAAPRPRAPAPPPAPRGSRWPARGVRRPQVRRAERRRRAARRRLGLLGLGAEQLGVALLLLARTAPERAREVALDQPLRACRAPRRGRRTACIRSPRCLSSPGVCGPRSISTHITASLGAVHRQRFGEQVAVLRRAAAGPARQARQAAALQAVRARRGSSPRRSRRPGRGWSTGCRPGAARSATAGRRRASCAASPAGSRARGSARRESSRFDRRHSIMTPTAAARAGRRCAAPAGTLRRPSLQSIA